MPRRDVREDLAAEPERVDVDAALLEVIARNIENHERSQQFGIGASEIGTPCVRKLALKLADAPAVPGQSDGEDGWRSAVGTAVHAQLATWFAAENTRYADNGGTWYAESADACHPWCTSTNHTPHHRDRYLIEYKTPIGTIDGREVPGNLDIYDRWTRTLVDWKIVGPTTLKNVKRAHDPGEQYRVQGQLYGRGLKRKGNEDVRWIGVMFLPSNGELKHRYYYEAPFDPTVGRDALKRAREIKSLVDDAGDESIFRKLKTTLDHCAHCPFFSPGSDEPTECPGDPEMTANMDDGFADLAPGL